MSAKAWTALVAATVAAMRPGFHHFEVDTTRAVNQLPDATTPAQSVVMQLGALGAVPAVAGGLWLTGRRRDAVRAAVAGTSAWLLAKLFKRTTGRARPSGHGWLVVRGGEHSGLGYPSGHAAVSAALATIVAATSGGSVAAGFRLAAALTGIARVHVAAHYPLDVIGGAAMGVILAEATSDL